MTKTEQKKIAITHASGLLGEALLESMAASGIDSEQVVLLDQQGLAGNRLAFGSTYLDVQDQLEFDYENLLAVLLLEPHAELEDLLQHAECFVISHHAVSDKAVFVNPQSASFNLPDTPCALHLPSAELATLLLAVQPVHDQFELKMLNVVNVLSAAFYGKTGVEELAGQTISLLNTQPVKSSAFPMQLAFNMFAPESEQDFEQQLTAALDFEDVKCAVQQLLIPAFHGLAISINLETVNAINLQALAGKFKQRPGLQLVDTEVSPVTHCMDCSDVIINQLSQPQSDSNRLQFWIFADTVKNGLLQNYQKTIEVLLKSFL
jgi:aspartate-semialdehyde dehydrogenase